MPFVICFRIDEWTESMLSITSSQKCSIVQLMIPSASLLGTLPVLSAHSFASN